MDLEYGQGYPDAVFNISTGRVVMYNDPNDQGGDPFGELLRERSGRQYYTSRSGMSGAAWLPDSLTLRPLSVLRIDVARPRVPSSTAIVPGGPRVVVLSEHLKRVVYPITALVVDNKEKVVTVFRGDHLIEQLLRGQLDSHDEGGERNIHLSSWGTSRRRGIGSADLGFEVTVRGGLPRLGKLGPRRVLELLFWDELYRKELQHPRGDIETAWTRGLGLKAAADGELYHSAGGIFRRPAELTRESLSKACPWAHFVSDDLAYIIEDEEGFQLVERQEGDTILQDDGSLGDCVEPKRLTLPEAYDLLKQVTKLEETAVSDPATEVKASADADGEPRAEWERELLAGE